MRKALAYILVTVAALAVWAVTSCSNESCLENQSAVPRCGFYSSQSKKQVSIDSITVYAVGVPGDTMLVECGRSVAKLYMPLDMGNDVTRYVIHYDAVLLSDVRYNDTLTIHYERVPYFVSHECGAMYYFDVKDYGCTNHLIDSVTITADRFTNLDVETIQFYMRTSEE
ncbi:MAG: DUF6452 family protein [Muribaculaceae bacterium]